jgi:hypothetical protein
MSWQDAMERAARRRPEVEVQLARLEELHDPETRACRIALIRVPVGAVRGTASQALDTLCREADRHKVVLHVTPDPLPRTHGLALPRARLKAWYGRRGFVPNTGRKIDLRITDALIRQPRNI